MSRDEMEHFPFMLGQTWFSLAVVIGIGIGLGVRWSQIAGSRGWSYRRRNVARWTGVVAAVIPPTMVALGSIWINDHGAEGLRNYDPYVPQWLLRALDIMWWTEVLALACLVVIGRHARSILIPIAVVQAVFAFFAYFTSGCAVTGSWL